MQTSAGTLFGRLTGLVVAGVMVLVVGAAVAPFVFPDVKASAERQLQDYVNAQNAVIAAEANRLDEARRSAPTVEDAVAHLMVPVRAKQGVIVLVEILLPLAGAGFVGLLLMRGLLRILKRADDQARVSYRNNIRVDREAAHAENIVYLVPRTPPLGSRREDPQEWRNVSGGD